MAAIAPAEPQAPRFNTCNSVAERTIRANG